MPVLLALCLVAALLAPGSALASPITVADALVPGGLLVTTRGPEVTRTLLDTIAATLPGAAVERLTRRVLGVRVPPGREQALGRVIADLPGVVTVEREGWMRPQRTPDDPMFAEQWSHARTDVEDAWDETVGHDDVRVAVIDSGIVGTHPDLAPNIREPQVSTAGEGAATPRGVLVDNDPCDSGHGTFVAGVLGARGDNGTLMAGVAWQVSILDVSALGPDNCGGLRDSDILQGMEYAASNPSGPVDVVNMSFGRPADRCPSSYAATVADLRADGVVVVAAAGNGEATPATVGKPMIPASCDGVISVGASGRDDARADYSSTNPFVDLTAPGGHKSDGETGWILSTAFDEDGRWGYAYQVGTSHAAPYVSGVAALLRAEHPDLTPDGVESALERSTKDLARPGRDNGTGWGLVRPAEALALAARSLPPADPDPEFPVDQDSETWSPPRVARVAAQGSATAPITQAVAVSRTLFGDDDAGHAVLARDDDFADALAGSALGNGLGPLLFTSRTGELAGATRTELQRALPSGSTVYLLGGHAALPPRLEDELRAVGFSPVRLSGSSREQTAAAVAAEVDRRSLRALRGVLLARADQWPDAVAAGSLAAWFGMPILLTSPSSLHPATAEALRTLAPDRVYALGGSAAIAPDVLDAAGAAANLPASRRRRLAGPDRAGTAVAIATEMESLLREHGDGAPGDVLAVNVRRSDGFTHALSASAIAGATGAVMIPVEGTNGQTLPTVARDYVRGFGIDGLLIGGTDVVSAGVGEQLEDLLRG